jgi:hypothetical protein
MLRAKRASAVKLFRLTLARCSDNFLLFIFRGQSITALGNPARPGYYYWAYYRLLVSPGVPRLLRLTY